MIYPTLVLCFAFLVLAGMLMFLVPIFEDIFKDLDGELPILTKIIVAASDIMKGYWFIVFPAIGGAIYGFRRWKKTPSGRQVWDRFKLHAPAGIGKVVLKVTMARFSRTLATLVAAGVDINQGARDLRPDCGQLGGRVRARGRPGEGPPGRADRGAPHDNPVFPPLVSQMVKVGEETGELEKMLDKIADFYEDEVDASIQALTSIVEPLMMIGVGLVVGIIIIAMYMPMFKLLQLVE